MNFCVVGSGSIGKRHIKNIALICQSQGIDFSIDLFRSTSSVLPDEILKTINIQTTKFNELNDFYDGVIVCNPTHLHYETIKLFQGKTRNFFIEKPVFETPDKSISEFEANNGTQYYVACPLRYLNVFESAKEIILNQEIWSVRSICSTYLPSWRPGQDYSKLYSAHKNQGGGVEIDLIHEWDYLISLFGFPKNVSMLSGKYSSLKIDSDDLAIYIAQYDKFLLELHLDYFGKESQRFMELYCESGVYRFDLINNCFYLNGKVIKEYNEDPNDKYIKEMTFFFHMITKNVQSNNTLDNNLNVMKIALSNI